MKKIIISLVILFAGYFTTAQNITTAEYFIDNDPGPGNGIAIALTAGSNPIFTATIPVNTFAPGFHFAAIRVKDTDGQWGLFETRGFYISTAVTTNVSNIVAAEYFVDSDPGVGNGTAVSLSTGANPVFVATIPVNALAPGFHFAAIRTKDADGKWGVFETKGFYVTSTATNVSNIIAAEYYYDTDPGVGNGTSIALPASTANYIDSLILPIGSLPTGDHQIAIRVKNAEGKWSLLENKKITVCSRYGPVSRLNYQIENNRVFFTNLSRDNDATLWKFGDGTTDTVLNPIKTYSSAGNFAVELISSNICAADTFRMISNIAGLQRVNANKAGNQGVATVIFDGNGFTAGTSLKLIRNGVTLLPADKKLISTTRIIGYFNLNGTDTGRYDVVAVLGGGSLDTIKNGFLITIAKYPMVSLVELSGTRTRVGRNTVVNNLQNRGNEDAIMLPFASVIGYKPGTISFGSTDSMVDLSTQGIFQNTFQYLNAHSISPAVMNAVDVDTVRKKQLLSYYRVKVPSESFVRNNFVIANSFGAITYDIRSLVHPPLFKSAIAINDISAPNARDCMNSFLKRALKKNIPVSINDSAWNSCFNMAFDTLARTVRDIVRDINQQEKSIPMKAVYATLLVRMSQCSGSGVPPTFTSVQFDKIIKDVTYNWLFLESLDSIGRPCIDTTENYVFNGTVIGNTNQSNNINRQINGIQTPECPGAAAFPELAELCKDFADPCEAAKDIAFHDDNLLNTIGRKIFDKLTGMLGPEGSDGFCSVNSATAGCKKFCETTAWDPNVKFGPGNNNNQKHVNYLTNYGYTIFFENLATATAPAAYVEVTDTLDKTKFDISTFQTGAFGWGDSIIITDANRNDFSILKDLRPAKPNKLRVDIRIDTITGIVNWKFFTLDTATLQLTDDPTQGFLPPNINGTEGVGFVSFSVKPKNGTTSGAVIKNKARIVFDDNPPILTPLWEHIVDTTRPQSNVAILPPVITTNDFVVNWSGSDAHAGIDEYAVYVSVNDSLFKKWKKFTTSVSDTFHAENGKTYKFFSVALDKAGNFESAPPDPTANPDAVTTIQIPLTTGWTGNISTDWSNPGNWSNGVPGTITDVTIQAGRPRYPVLIYNVNVHSLHLDPGTSVTISNGINIIINGN